MYRQAVRGACDPYRYDLSMAQTAPARSDTLLTRGLSLSLFYRDAAVDADIVSEEIDGRYRVVSVLPRCNGRNSFNLTFLLEDPSRETLFVRTYLFGDGTFYDRDDYPVTTADDVRFMLR